MKYIRSTPNPSGAYPPPQGHPAPGLVAITEEQAALVVQYNGFVTLTAEDGAATVTPNTAAWEVWQSQQVSLLSEEPSKTTEEILADHEARIAALEKLLAGEVSV